MFTLLTDPNGPSAIFSLAMFAIAGGIFWLGRRKGPVLASAWVTIAVFGGAGLLPIIGYLRSFAPYHVHVNVVGPPGVSVDYAKVWSSIEAESAKVADGWELKIPASNLPNDRTLLVWAALDPHDTKHSRAIALRADHYPVVTIKITGDRSATVAGVVKSRDGLPIDHVFVSRSDRGQDTILTEDSGKFQLPVDTQAGDELELQFASGGYLTKNVWVTAGNQVLEIVLDRHRGQE